MTQERLEELRQIAKEAYDGLTSFTAEERDVIIDNLNILRVKSIKDDIILLGKNKAVHEEHALELEAKMKELTLRLEHLTKKLES